MPSGQSKAQCGKDKVTLRRGQVKLLAGGPNPRGVSRKGTKQTNGSSLRLCVFPWRLCVKLLSQYFARGADSGGECAVHCTMMPLCIRRLARKEDRIFHRTGQLGLRVQTTHRNVAISPQRELIFLPIMEVKLHELFLEHPLRNGKYAA